MEYIPLNVQVKIAKNRIHIQNMNINLSNKQEMVIGFLHGSLTLMSIF